MKIVSIFASNLFTFHYAGEIYNEYERLMDVWTDVEYLRNYARENGISDAHAFLDEIQDHVAKIQDIMDSKPLGSSLEEYFRPLNDLETRTPELSLRKGKIRQSKLRLYAVRIDNGMFVITGGAIKLTHKMQEHPDTEKERRKLNSARAFLRAEHIFDGDSFFELITD